MRTRVCLLLAAVVVLLGSSAAPLCAEQPAVAALARPTGVFSQYGGSGQGIALQGNYAYVGMGPRLLVFRLNGTAAPTFIARSGLLPGVARRIVISGTRAYVAMEKAGVAVVDITTATQPVLLGICDTPGTALGVAVLPGNRVAVADGEAYLRIVDVADPAHPVEVGSLPGVGAMRAVCAMGSTVYVAEVGARYMNGNIRTGACLRVVDAADPAQPVSVSFTEANRGLASSIVVKGTTVYVGADRDWNIGWQAYGVLQAFDVSNPAAPVASLPDTADTRDIAISGNLLYAANSDGMRVYDLSTPLAPPTVAFSITYRGMQGVATTASGLVYAVEVNRLLLQRRSAADPEAIELLQTVGLPGYGSYIGIDLHGGRGYALGGGLQVFDLSLQSGARVLGSVAVAGGDIALGERYAYLISAGGAASYLSVVDISNSSNPILMNQIPDYGQNVALQGNYVYVHRWDRGLEIWELNDPVHPQKVGELDIYCPGESQHRLAVQGNYAYVATGNDVRVIDVSDPANPVEAGVYAGDNWDFIGVSVSGDRAYVTQRRGITPASLPDALLILDISDPANITERGRIGLPEWPYVGRALGDRVYVANGDDGVQVVDVSDEAHPVVVASYPLAGHCTDLAVDGAGRVLATCSAGGVYVITPELPYSTYLPLIRRP